MLEKIKKIWEAIKTAIEFIKKIKNIFSSSNTDTTK